MQPKLYTTLVSDFASILPQPDLVHESGTRLFEIYRKILSHFHAQGLVVAKLMRSLKPRLCTALAAISLHAFFFCFL
jgi:hypothetical protein